MKSKFQLLIILAIILPSLASAQKSKSLFNHKSLKGWYAYTNETGKQVKADEVFNVEDGMIRIYGKNAGYLMSGKSFENFRLTVEFRWNTNEAVERKSNKKNSGIMYLVPSETPDQLWPKGIQFQVKEGATGDFILLHEVALTVKDQPVEPGSSVVSKRFADAAKPVGEWNTAVITVRNGNVIQELNGTLVNEGTNASVTEGRVLLQYEGYPIDFRTIEIEKLR